MGRKWGRTDQGDDHWRSRTGSAGTGEEKEVLNSETWRLQTSENASDVSHVAKHWTCFSILHVAPMAYYWVPACTTLSPPTAFSTLVLFPRICAVRMSDWWKPKENASIHIQPLTSSHGCLWNVCRQITAPNSLNDSPKQGLTKTLLFLSVN